MKDLALLAALLLVSALLVLAIHAALVSYTEAHPVPVYYEEAPAPTPTYYDPSSNYGGGSYAYYNYTYPYPGYVAPVATTQPPAAATQITMMRGRKRF